jgi:hypothetical protein
VKGRKAGRSGCLVSRGRLAGSGKSQTGVAGIGGYGERGGCD